MDAESEKAPKSKRRSLGALFKGLRLRRHREQVARADPNSTNQSASSSAPPPVPTPNPIPNPIPEQEQTASPKTPSADDAMKPSKEQQPTTGVDGALPVEAEQVSRVLRETDIEALFSSAPQYTISREGTVPVISVGFPWEFDLLSRDTSDSKPIGHPAFSSSTLRPHLSAPGKQVDRPRQIPGFDIATTEVPNMLRADGNEAGSVGLEFYAQLGSADWLQGDADEDQEESEKNWKLFHRSPEKLGIRTFERMIVYERLAELCQMSAEFGKTDKVKSILDKQTPSELYALLYAQLLQPPRFDAGSEDPTGLKVQVESLSKILGLKGIWYDFSLVENRVRLGQLFWTVDEQSERDMGLPERDVLVLQITLAAELLLRLDAISTAPVEYVHQKLHLTAENMKSFQELHTKKLSWDLVLARRFLSSVKVVCSQAPIPTPPTPGRPFFSSGTDRDDPENVELVLCLLPRHLDNQLNGLIAFAQAIGWPDIDELRSELEDKYRDPFEKLMRQTMTQIVSPNLYMTPVVSPPSAANGAQADYFSRRGTHKQNHSPGGRSSRASGQDARSRFTVQLTTPSQSILAPSGPAGHTGTSALMSATKSMITPPETFMAPPSWVTPTYLTGLVLPGSTTSYFLLATLLENSPSALERIGESASLTTGFAYSGRSWWSSECVLGRVLAGMPGTKFCMGWAGTPVAPMEGYEGWIDIGGAVVEGRRNWSTIANEKEMEREMEAVTGLRGLLGDEYEGDGELMAAADEFIIPSEPSYVKRTGLWFEGLKLVPSPKEAAAQQSANRDSDAAETPVAKDVMPHLLFSSTSLGDNYGTQSAEIRYDVYFISAWPCRPPKDVSVIKGPAEFVDQDGVHVEDLPSHPLHKEHKYTIIAAGTLLSTYAPPRGEEEWAVAGVLVLDARGDATLELVARAWCAREGYDAVIGRVMADGGGDRAVEGTCLACCVREARVAGVKVVIRVSS